MSVMAFRRLWTCHYPDHEPVGYEMLCGRAQHWVRFHSLPKSKRYPDTEPEWRELLQRQNQLAVTVLGDDQDCWLVQSRWNPGPGVTDVAFNDGNDPFRAIVDYGLEFAIATVREAGTEFETRWEAFAGPTSWKPGRFDRLLREIADERAAPTLWVSNETGAVFAPYDGGVDLFLPAKRDVGKLAGQHPEWLSTHPLGL